jgi:transcriptional regulator with XRE-family HTH domain
MKLSEKVKNAMDKLGCSQKDLAKAAGISQNSVSRLVTGAMDAACSLDIYLPVKQALGLRGEEPACSLHVQPLQAKPRPAREAKADRPNDYNQAAIMGRLAAIEQRLMTIQHALSILIGDGDNRNNIEEIQEAAKAGKEIA